MPGSAQPRRLPPAGTRPAGLAGHRRRDRGAATLELAILFPVVLMLTFGAVQVGLWYSARSMCQAAAQAGARAAKVTGAPNGAGAAAARGYLSAVAGGLVVTPAITENRTPGTVTVQVSGRAQSVLPLPGFSVTVSQSASAGRERFTTP